MGISERGRKLAAVKKDDIIDAMEAVLQTKSYERVTVDEVAQAAEYSKKTVYAYFRSKDEIYLALLGRKFDLLYETLAAAAAGRRGTQKLAVLARAYYGFARVQPACMQDMIDFDETKFAADAGLADVMAHFRCETAKSFRLLEEAVREAEADGARIAGADAAGTAVWLWAGINGFLSLAGKKGAFVKGCCGQTADELFEAGLARVAALLEKRAET